jgi:hypothetical protein
MPERLFILRRLPPLRTDLILQFGAYRISTAWGLILCRGEGPETCS